MTPRARSRALRIGGLALAILAVGWGLRAMGNRPVARALRARTVESTALGSGRTMSNILQQLGKFHSVPASVDRGNRPVLGAPGAPGGQLFSLDPLTHDELVTVFGIEPAWLAKPVAVAALLIDPNKLEELRQSPHLRGRAWERTGFLAYVVDGELQSASQVGVRLHGGWTRTRPKLASYRLYFRKRYGLDRLAPSPFPSRQENPPRQVIVRRDGQRTAAGKFRQFTTSMAYDIARRLDVPAPETQPIVFYLNGQLKGVWSLSEWIQRDYLAAHFGHDDFVLVRTKRSRGQTAEAVKEGDPAVFQAFRSWVQQTPRLTMAEVETRFDLDNLLHWFIAVAYCGTGDALQGSLVLDQTDPEARWNIIAWDMDQSFGYGKRPGNWRHNNLSHVLQAPDLRSRLLRRLTRDDPEFLGRLLDTMSEALNHTLDAEFLHRLLVRYRDDARLYAVDEFDASLFEGWFENRRAELVKQLALRYNVEVQQVVVEAPPGVEFVVDGYPYSSPYQGWYFTGQTITVATGDGEPASWWVDDQERPGRELTLEAGQVRRLQWR